MLLAIEPFCLRTFSIGPVCRIFRSYHHRHRPLKFVGAEEFSLGLTIVTLGDRPTGSTDRPRYSVGNNRLSLSAHWRSQILLLSTATTSIYWSSRLYIIKSTSAISSYIKL